MTDKLTEIFKQFTQGLGRIWLLDLYAFICSPENILLYNPDTVIRYKICILHKQCANIFITAIQLMLCFSALLV